MREAFFECKVLSQKIVEFKKKNKLTYQQIGEALGVDKSYINRVVKLDSYPSLPVLIQLAKFMRIPLYALFLPSDELIRQEFIHEAQIQMENMKLSFDELGRTTSLSPIRLMEIFDGKSMLTNEERTLLTSALDIPENLIYQIDKISILENVVNDLDLQDSRKETILKYFKEYLR